MTHERKRDLVIHYDEESQKLVCYSTPASRTREIRESEFGLEVPVSTYLAMASEEAERVMGEGVFALIDLHSVQPIGIRDYKSLSASTEHNHLTALEAAAKSGNSEAQYSLAMELFTNATRSRDRDLLEQAEGWLKTAAASGSADAATYLKEHWERSKASAVRGMSRSAE